MKIYSHHIETKTEIHYDGSQLRPHWIYETFGISDNAIISFVGSADVPLTSMVDLEDVKAASPIFSKKMIHFIGEWFHISFLESLYKQRLFLGHCQETLQKLSRKEITRKGDDLYFEDRKLSVSIITAETFSTLMHTAINIESEGTPVPTSSLGQLNVNPFEFSQTVIQSFFEEEASIRFASVKVRAPISRGLIDNPQKQNDPSCPSIFN